MTSFPHRITVPPASEISASRTDAETVSLAQARAHLLATIAPLLTGTRVTRAMLLETVNACGWCACYMLPQHEPILSEIAAVCALLSCYSAPALRLVRGGRR